MDTKRNFAAEYTNNYITDWKSTMENVNTGVVLQTDYGLIDAANEEFGLLNFDLKNNDKGGYVNCKTTSYNNKTGLEELEKFCVNYYINHWTPATFGHAPQKNIEIQNKPQETIIFTNEAGNNGSNWSPVEDTRNCYGMSKPCIEVISDCSQKDNIMQGFNFQQKGTEEPFQIFSDDNFLNFLTSEDTVLSTRSVQIHKQNPEVQIESRFTANIVNTAINNASDSSPCENISQCMGEIYGKIGSNFLEKIIMQEFKTQQVKFKEPLSSCSNENSLDYMNSNSTKTGARRKHYPCNECEYSSSVKNFLHRHVKSAHSKKKKICHICSYKTVYKTVLGNHIGENPYSCSACNRKFSPREK